MIHTLNWDKISKTMLVSALVCASVGTTFLQSVSTKAEENAELDISVVAIKPNGTQIFELEANGKIFVSEITKEQIAVAEKELSKLSEVKQDILENKVDELATESIAPWMLKVGMVASFLSIALRVAFHRALGLCIRNLWICAFGAWEIATNMNTLDDIRRKLFG